MFNPQPQAQARKAHMNCHEFEHRLNAILDERGDPAADSRLLAHARQCAACGQMLAGQRLLLSGLRRLPIPPLRSDFSQRVVIKVGASPVRSVSASRIWLAVGAVLASAAAVLLAVSIVWYARRGGPQITANQPHPAVPHVAGPARLPSRGLTTLDQPLVKKKRSADSNRYASDRPSGAPFPERPEPTLPPPDWLIEAPRLPQHLRGSIDNLSVTIPETAQRLHEMEHLAPGLRPLRVSLTRIWDTLCSPLPSAPTSTDAPLKTRTSLFHLNDPLLA